MIKRLQNRIAESRMALPITAALALAVWLFCGLDCEYKDVRLGVLAISTYLMVEMNNRNALIRTYSRMVSCSFIVLMTMAANLFYSISFWVVQLCVIVALSILLRCYQDKRAQGKVFYAFFFIGVASAFFMQILFFVPFIWILMGTNLLTLSFRSVLASLLGLIAPYWFLAGHYWFMGDISPLLAHVMTITEFAPLLRYDGLNLHVALTFAFVAVITLTGIIHFIRNSYMDKIRTRMIYEMFIVLSFLVFLFAVLQPQHAIMLLPVMAVCASVLVAHYIALTHTRLTNVSFVLIAIMAVALTFYNIWIP